MVSPQGVTRRATARASVVALAVTTLLTSPLMPRAHGAELDPVLANAPMLVGSDALLGTVRDLDTTTDTPGSDPTACPAPGAGDVFIAKVPEGTARKIKVQVADDLGGPSVCRLALYDAAPTFLDPWDPDQRAASLLDASDACATGSTCTVHGWTHAGRGAYVIAWAFDDPDPAEFTYTARVRAKPSPRLGVDGHRQRNKCNGTFEGIKGRHVRLTARGPAGAPATIRLERKEDGVWIDGRSRDKTLHGGDATWTLGVDWSGKRRISVYLPPTDTHLEATSVTKKVKSVSPRWTRLQNGGVRLHVRYRKQQHRLSCESATLRMAHNYFHPGRIDRDMHIMNVMGISKRRPARDGGCNPNKKFCGDVNDYMMRGGYGVHSGPIARAARHYSACHTPVEIDGYRARRIAGYVDQGFPVIVWGAHPGASGVYRYVWRAHDGERIVAYSVEHTWTVIGFRGPPTDPTHFIVHDPSRGRDLVKTRGQFWRFTKYFRTAVVVRG